MKARLTKDFFFESAQTLPKVPPGHKCAKMHGHSFKVEVSVEGEVDADTGWLYDHAQISEAMNPLVAQLDHAYLNDIPGLENPTIELMAAWFWRKLAPNAPAFARSSFTRHPSARCSYRGDLAVASRRSSAEFGPALAPQLCSWRRLRNSRNRRLREDRTR